MKKIAVSGLIIATMVSNLLAESTVSVGEKIIGVEIGAGKIEADTFGILGENNHEGTDLEYGIRLGAQNEDWRTLLMVNYFNSSDDDQEYVKGQIAIDYFFVKDSPFKPFLGLNVGYIDYTTATNSGDESNTGFIYGGQVGILYHVMDEIEIDVSYRYSFSNADWVNHTEDIVFGVNYIF